MLMMNVLHRYGLLPAWLVAAPCLAQSTAFTYQGRLDEGGAPANGAYDLRFALYDAASAGAQQGIAVTQAAAAVGNGLFTGTRSVPTFARGSTIWRNGCPVPEPSESNQPQPHLEITP